MLSPVGRTALTRDCACVMLTWGCGARPGVAASAEGFFGRSTIVMIACKGDVKLCLIEGKVGRR
jgi:hypothetical protein